MNQRIEWSVEAVEAKNPKVQILKGLKNDGFLITTRRFTMKKTMVYDEENDGFFFVNQRFDNTTRK